MVFKGLYDGYSKTSQMFGLIRPILPCLELLACIKPFPSGLVGENDLLQLYPSEKLSQLEPLAQNMLAGNHLEMQISLDVWLLFLWYLLSNGIGCMEQLCSEQLLYMARETDL